MPSISRGLEEGSSKRGRAWGNARELGDGGIRRKLCRQKEGSDRFRVRAWADDIVSPTYIEGDSPEGRIRGGEPIWGSVWGSNHRRVPML